MIKTKKKAVEQQREIMRIEKEIDLMVYELYDLTHEEVLIVDEGFGMSMRNLKIMRLKRLRRKMLNEFWFYQDNS